MEKKETKLQTTDLRKFQKLETKIFLKTIKIGF